MKLDLDSLSVETFEPGEEPAAPESTTVDASLQWCLSTSGGQYLCLAYCESGQSCVAAC
jgi:hypothetical protein